jgi:hypothetical protein
LSEKDFGFITRWRGGDVVDGLRGQWRQTRHKNNIQLQPDDPISLGVASRL